METDLTIEGQGLPPFSARGCHQVLTPIRNGEYRRTIEGKLIFIGNDSHHKYRTKIRGQDKTTQTIEKWWRGEPVRVGCIQRLCQEFMGDGLRQRVELARLPIKGSVIVFDEAAEKRSLLKIQEREISFTEIPQKNKRLFISYRPLLDMMMIHHTVETDEWGHQVGWTLELEEV